MRIFRDLLGVVATIVVLNSLPAIGQEPATVPSSKPDFSGKWQLIEKESDKTGLFRMVITRKDDLLTIYAAFDDLLTINDLRFEKLTLNLDKSGETNKMNIRGEAVQNIKSVTKLDGDKIVRKFESETAIGWTTGSKSRIYYDNHETYSLSQDGNRLTIVLRQKQPPRVVSQIITATDTPTRVMQRVYSRVP